ncbi:MAG: tRNA (adenosine(37)-N6)-threonylcarbamoyltransferase complex dimerization subunit type 1 TsaB [Owenweeksia sp.]|nr:tRNA (adenosine(37)-N6)-threonylcarbamoyltransferase complex dimerization subunit type 1 TsaB [Owenweeksia sp.]
MALILGIETSTLNCSVALAQGGEVLSLRQENSDRYIHSETLHLFIQQVMQEAQLAVADVLEAVAVGKGPGSYTGLRIGVSAAKGLCYALNLPLISEDGLQILVKDFLGRQPIEKGDIIIPMLDARRMEVYYAPHQSDGKRLGDIKAKVIAENSFQDLEAPKVHLIGDRAEKCKEVLKDPRFVFHPLAFPSARALAGISSSEISKRAI